VQFCVDPVDNGALSSCPASEGHTWGKVSPEGVARSVYVHTDVTAVFPWITYALLSDQKRTRKHRRLFDDRAKAIKLLDKAVAKQRKELLETVEYPEGIGHAVSGEGGAPKSSGAEPVAAEADVTKRESKKQKKQNDGHAKVAEPEIQAKDAKREKRDEKRAAKVDKREAKAEKKKAKKDKKRK
jgi:hypothetical protein